MTDNMHEHAPNIPSQCPVENTKDSLLEAQADNSFDPREEDAVEIPDALEAERHIESPSSFRANIQISRDSPSHTPPASPNEDKDNATTHEATVEKTIRREKPTTSVQAGNEKDDEFAAQKPLRAEVHSPLQHNIQSSSQLHHLVATKSAHGQNGKRSSARKTSDGGKHSLIAVPPGRHISVSGQGSPIRLSHLEDNDVNSMPAEVPPLVIWGSTSYTRRLERPVVEATQHESNQGSNFAVALEIESSRPVSPAGLEENLGLRQSILSELKKEHANRRIASGQAKTHVTEPADHGRQQLHELVDACMQRLDSKKECIIKIADTYTKAGNHCVKRIQSRFGRERSAVIHLAKENTKTFNRHVSDGIKSIERNSARKSLSMNQFKLDMSARAASYAHASSALDKLHHAVLTGDKACSGSDA